MLRIALTGGIATGKSHVLARLAAAGIPTIDADVLVHRALAATSPLIPEIVSRFGPSVLDARGAVDRTVLGGIVFTDPAARADLERILHPHVYALIDEWFASLVPDGPDLTRADFAVADIPLLYETGHEKRFDRVIVTVCSPESQVKRMQDRNGLTEGQARQRLEAQWPIGEKARRADYVIDTGGSFAETDSRVDAVIEALSQLRP